MKKVVLIIIAVVAFVLVIMGMKSCTSIPQGNVGVKINLYGSEKGVDGEVLPPGRYFLTWNEQMFLFPTFQQTYIYTHSKDEGKSIDESFTFQTREGLEVGADIGVIFSIERIKANLLFQRYRHGIDEIIVGPLRGIIRDAFNKVASNVEVDYVYGVGKSKLIDSVTQLVKRYFEPFGIMIDRLYLSGSFRLPANVTAALNAKIEATQKAAQYQNEVAQAIAEANKQIAKARGDSTSIVIRALGEAQANKAKQLTLTALLVEYEKIQKWDGVLPQVTGGSIPMINLGKVEPKK